MTESTGEPVQSALDGAVLVLGSRELPGLLRAAFVLLEGIFAGAGKKLPSWGLGA
jgi:hypothetical protein